ncbi:TetR/AcrR family transcriptional regulator [Bhargavaea ullalensis]|uniref:AcrR family transcriptional regulator n=1 Tax=Bhargavaea ullalensis TaxID=1265685 RepID=A0ABV2G8N6_9BACL
MNETKRKIIEAAAALLTERGFHGTSVQDIADLAGISKGAFYLHFKSKDALLIEIFKYYSAEFKKELARAHDPLLSPAGNYRRQTEIQIDQFLRNTDFIMMYVREQAFSINEELVAFIRSLHAEVLRWYGSCLADMYGEEILPFAVDIATIVEGVKTSYMQLFITNPGNLDPGSLADLLFRLTEQAAESFLSGRQPALLDGGNVRGLFSELFPDHDGRTKAIRAEIEAMRTLADTLPLSASAAAYLGSTVDFIDAQAGAGEDIDRTAVQGALAAFSPYPEFQDSAGRLAGLLGL